MKIAIFHELVSGGARRSANEFSKALISVGHKVDLYIVDQKMPEDEKDFYDSVYYYQFTPKKWEGKNWRIKLYKDSIELIFLYKLHKKIAGDIEKKGYDFVFIHPSQYTQAPFLLQFISLPKIYYCQEPLRMIYEKELDETEKLEFFRKIYEKIIRKLRKEIDKKSILAADLVFANSTFSQKNIENAYGVKTVVCHLGVDMNKFHEITVKKDIDVLYIGSKNPVDGLSLFTRAVTYMDVKPNIEYLLRGEKWITDDQLCYLYSRAKMVISFGKREPFGLVPLEAMACGGVVIALNEGGYKDSISINTGLLVSSNPEEIAKMITKILQDDSLRKKMSEQAKKEIKLHWLWSQSAEIVINQYQLWEKNH